jgi:hypothetical protein
MTVLQELIVPLKLENQGFNSGIESSITKASAFGSFLGNIASTAVTGAFHLLGEGIDKLGGFLKSTVEEASSAQDAIGQLEAVIKSTGGVAGVTSEEAQNLASSLQKVTKFSDEAILGGENMLLTFTSIGKQVFPRATQTILDMSQALGQDLKSSAIQLGKALNDPIAGVSALRRVGVQFTDEQESMIKKMVESGNLMQAQTFILDELQKEFGGSAVAAGQTFGGQLEILKNKLSDVKENIGNAILPILQTLTGAFGRIIDSPAFQSAIDLITGKLGELSTWIQDNLPIWEEKFTTWLGNVSIWWNEKAKPALEELKGWLDKIIPDAADENITAWDRVVNTYNTNVKPVVDGLIRLFGNLNDILERLDPSTEKVAGKFTLLGIIQREAVALATVMNFTFQLMGATLEAINTVIERGVKFWDRYKDSILKVVSALSRLVIPWWLTPGSPTPLENGLRGIGTALDSINGKSLPDFKNGLNINSTPATSSSSIDYNKLARVLATELAKATG